MYLHPSGSWQCDFLAPVLSLPQSQNTHTNLKQFLNNMFVWLMRPIHVKVRPASTPNELKGHVALVSTEVK